MTQPIGNEGNMEKIREAMELHQKVQQGGNLKEGVPIDFTSMTGKVYKGVVVFKLPNMMDYMKMGGLKSEFLRLGGAKDIKLVDDSIKFMAHVMSTLEVVLVKRPEWLLKLDEVLEPDVLYHVFYKYEEWENSFRSPVQPQTEGTSGAKQGTEAVDA